MRLSPDEIVFWQYGDFKLNATIVFTWGLMLFLVGGSVLVTRKLSKDHNRSRWQNLLEIVVIGIAKQLEEIGLRQPQKYLGFLGRVEVPVIAEEAAKTSAERPKWTIAGVISPSPQW